MNLAARLLASVMLGVAAFFFALLTLSFMDSARYGVMSVYAGMTLLCIGLIVSLLLFAPKRSE